MKSLLEYMTGFLTAILIMTLPLDASAGTYKEKFWNEYQTDSIYLFLNDEDVDHDVIFQDVSLKSSSAWSIAAQTDTYLQFNGPTASPRRVRFDITFTDNRATKDILPFTLEWAEYLNGSFAAPDAFGSLMLSPKGKGNSYQWTSSDDFSSPIPNPLPASTWLLLSGLFFLAGFRRHARG